MNDMTVGMENLPNVFIDKISIEPSLISRVPMRIQYRIRVMVKMYDYAITPSWRNKLIGLKVKCSFVSDDKIDLLNNGSISLYDISTGALNRTSVKSCDSFRFQNRVNNFESYSEVFELYIIDPPPNLNVYVACFIDGLGFNIPMFDKFYGPMAAEKIFVGGEINALSNYFYYPDTNEEYGGPVHQKSDGSFMEGSQHSDEPHKDVVLVTEENYKITSGPNPDIGLFAGMELTRTPEENRTELRPGFVDPGEDTSGNTTGVSVEDPNVPDSTPDRIY